ncbi:MAG TPA: alpha/beta hydrolase domain-containing protein [Caldimonas sp.]|jgi:hypothetical protein|nr:alpha/beta hydrolase domain-containing protein [Caldimonas sp.]HEX2541647.1 alpha/beta hydrolase domain-containing protein [Caldimonas sp.]
MSIRYTLLPAREASTTRPLPTGKRLALAACAACALAAPLAEARITQVVIDPARSQAVTFGGLSFGSVGQYQKLRGTAFGELDPNDPHNQVITDIELAPRNAAGMVEYSMDILILKPVDPSKGNRRLFLDFNNRGQLRAARFHDTALTNDPTTAAHAGNGFLMKHGYSIVGNGWDFGATGADSMKISVPRIVGLTGPSYEYIVIDNATTQTFNLAFAAASTNTSLAKLTVRARLDDAPVTLPASAWEYSNAAGTAIRLLPAGTPFTQSAIYELTYTAKDPAVSGIGLAATRDWVTFLRSASAAQGNPLAGHIDYAYSYSISQPSRTLNDFQYLGFNEGEDGRRVLDGILSHTGGGSGDMINYRFGQTGRTERNRQNHLYPEGIFPFAHQKLTDHLSGRTDGRSVRCSGDDDDRRPGRRAGRGGGKNPGTNDTCPKRVEVNTANEYWVKAGSLLHTDTHGRELKEPDNVRYYLMSGQSHGVGDITDRGNCQQFTNGVSPYPAHRALLLALDRWVTTGAKPPRSEVPGEGDRAWAVTRPGFQTGVVPQKALGWPDIPGVTYNGVITTRYFLDFGSRLDEGIISNYPPSLAGRPSYPIFVSKVDKDGNEIAGVRMPGVAAPVATTTGWALRRAGFSENEGCEADGQHIPFAVTKAERQASGDPRKSLEERYKNHAGYVKAVAKAARDLQKDGFLLEDDVQKFIAEAEASDVLR